MCGIAGAIAGGPGVVERMLEGLVHRGPDGRGVADGRLARLGCARLRIRGGDDGAQPLRTKRGLLVFNGEIYNTTGTGNGTDGVMFALNGAIYTGVDLTETAVEATRRHFEVVGLRGTFRKENAEALRFADNSFDIVYSHGVIHHTPDTAQAISEVHRVL